MPYEDKRRKGRKKAIRTKLDMDCLNQQNITDGKKNKITGLQLKSTE